MNNNVIQMALQARVCGANSTKYEHSPAALLSASALQYLVMAYVEDNNDGMVKQKVLEHINNLTVSGNEPAFGLATNWCYPMLVNSIAIIRKQPLWNELSERTQKKLHCIMKCFAYILHYACDKDNNYETSLRHDSHWSRGWAPNSRIDFICYAPILADYFGGREAFADLFTKFDYDAFVAELKECELNRALQAFTAPAIETEIGITLPSAKEILEGAREDQYYYNPNEQSTSILYGGTGKGIMREFLYSKRNAIPASSNEMLKQGLAQTYINKCKSTVEFNGVSAGIADGTVSPYEGQVGMFFELDENWRGGRSCMNRAMIDFAITTSCLAAAKLLGLFDMAEEETFYSLYDRREVTGEELRNRVTVGNNDLIYKLSHGYNSLNDDYLNVVYERAFAGYFFWKDIWQNYLQK